jgi:TatD family-associated radical SAM protein
MPMQLFYRSGEKLFANITNKCPCDCIFCIRKTTNGYGDAENLWLQHEPSVDEIKTAFTARNDLHEFEEIVFCGFGEPMERAKDVIELARFFKKNAPHAKIRINTNGLVRLIHPDFDMQQLSEIDTVSISLNADDAREYTRITRPRFGETAYAELLAFAETAKKFTAVTLTVVSIIEPRRIENCRKIAQNLGVSFRAR